jgi:hypothetical protein
VRPGREIRVQSELTCAPQLRIADEPLSAPHGDSAREPVAKADDGAWRSGLRPERLATGTHAGTGGDRSYRLYA